MINIICNKQSDWLLIIIGSMMSSPKMVSKDHYLKPNPIGLQKARLLCKKFTSQSAHTS